MSQLQVPVEWSDSLRIGLDAIDSDHRILVDMINQIHAARNAPEMPEVVGTVIKALVEYTIYHFRREERVLEAIGYPDLGAHMESHARLKTIADDIQERFLDDSSNVDMDWLSQFMMTWLVEHILQEDKAYAPFVARHRHRAEAAAASMDFMIGEEIDPDHLEDDPFLFQGD